MNLTQKQLEGKHCLVCSREISQPRGGHRRMYCGDSCSHQFRCYTSPEQQSQIKQQLREAQYILKHGQQQPRRTRNSIQFYICKRCGEAFEDYKYKKRIYCSRDCNNKSHRYSDSENLAVTEEIRLLPSSATQCAAKEMRAAGKTNTEIADALGCNLSTVQGWLRNTRRKTTPAQHRPFSEPFYRYIHARSAVEWRAVLQDEMQCNPAYAGLEFPQDRPVTLVCGTVFSRTKLYALAALAESLGLDPLNGNTYAFCSPEREWLIFLRWDGSGFQLTKRQRDYGRYVWPGEKLGKSIAVTALEFEFILFGSQKKEKLGKT
jgi:uncharacterized C2H2 Zn-finger protein